MASSSKCFDVELVLKRDLEVAGLLVPPPCLKKFSKNLQVAKDMVVTGVSLGNKSSSKRKESPPNKKLEKTFLSRGKMAIKEEAEPWPTTNTRSRRPNSLMGSEEGYTLPTWSKDKRKSTISLSPCGEEKMLKPNVKVSKRPRYFREYGEEQVGKKIRVWWPLDKTYSEGNVSSFDPTSMMHTLLHDDGDEEMLDLGEERWEQIETTSP